MFALYSLHRETRKLMALLLTFTLELLKEIASYIRFMKGRLCFKCSECIVTLKVPDSWPEMPLE
jgi:hypothetical protein